MEWRVEILGDTVRQTAALNFHLSINKAKDFASNAHVAAEKLQILKHERVATGSRWPSKINAIKISMQT